MDELKRTDPEIFDLIKQEERYEIDSVRLIASENYVSKAVLEATGSILTNKYSEGYPDAAITRVSATSIRLKTLAVDRAKALFNVDHANVQPYSGSPANVAVYFALLKPGDTIMGLALPHGGHLTHGWPVSITGTFWRRPVCGGSRESRRRFRPGPRDGAKGAAENHRDRRHGVSAAVGLQEFQRDR